MDSEKLALVKLDYEKTLAFLDKMDNILFQVRNWTVVSGSAVISYAVSNKSALILSANILIVACFFFIEITYKSFHNDGIRHSYNLEKIIQSGSLEDYPNYAFGIGHAIRAPNLKRIIRHLFNKSRWHIQVFYLIILLITFAAACWIRFIG